MNSEEHLMKNLMRSSPGAMRSLKDHDPYDDEDSPQFFVRPQMDDATRSAAVLAVREAMEAFRGQKWYQTLWANVRFGLFWVGYKTRLVIGLAYLKWHGRLKPGVAENTGLAKKVGRVLGL